MASVGSPGERARTLLGLSWLMIRLGRKAEVGHGGALRQQPANCWIVGHGDRHAVRSLEESS